MNQQVFALPRGYVLDFETNPELYRAVVNGGAQTAPVTHCTRCPNCGITHVV